MKLAIVRHGDALSPEEDANRPLSRRGRKQAETAGRKLAQAGMRPAAIHHSGKVRAEETARIIADCLPGSPDPIAVAGLGPNDPVKPVAAEINRRETDLLLVGHLPFVRLLAGQLVGDTRMTLPGFPTGGVALLQRLPDGGWTIEEVISPTS